jgi:hypothetical protein
MDRQSKLCGIVLTAEEFKPTIHSKYTGMLTKGVFLHHDNAQTHLAATINETNQELKFGLPSHPAYSAHLFPNDYNTFRLLNMCCTNANLQMKRFKNVMHTWLHTQLKNSLQMAPGSSKTEVNKHVEKPGNYIKNDYMYSSVPYTVNKNNKLPLLFEIPL